MGLQPNLASRPDVVSGAVPQKFGAQKTSNFGPLFATSAFDTAYLRNETSYRQTKMQVSIYDVSLNDDLLSVTVDPETAEIRLLIVTQHSAAITSQPSKLRHL